jgi:hypothetical protein
MRPSSRSVAGLATLGALLLTVPAFLYVLAFSDLAPARELNVPGLSIVVAAGAIYVLIAMRIAQPSAGAMIAGTSRVLGVVSAVAIVPALLLAKLDAMMGGSGSGGFAAVLFVYSALQFTLASAARSLPGVPPRLRDTGAFGAGAAIGIFFLLSVHPLSALPQRAQRQSRLREFQRRDRARADVFAIYSCAAAHRARDPRHEYPASLRALGPEGDGCLGADLAVGEREGWAYEYSRRASGDSVAPGFTLRVGPRPRALVPVLAIDEHGLLRQGSVQSPIAAETPVETPGTQVLAALRDCQRFHRDSLGRPPATLEELRAFARSLRGQWTPARCGGLLGLEGNPDWMRIGPRRDPNVWEGSAYTVTFTPAAGDSAVVAFEARPRQQGVTSVWNYLSLSSGEVHATTEPRRATAADSLVPRCVFGAGPAGDPRCMPASSPPPEATLVVDSVVDATGFTVALADPRDARSDNVAAGFQYAFVCGGLGSGKFGPDPTRTCQAPWYADSLDVTARIRNADLAEREYTRRVAVRQPPLSLTIAPPPPIELGDVLVLAPEAVGRNPKETLDYTVRIGDASVVGRWMRASGSTLGCRAATSGQQSDCQYPAAAGTYGVTVTVRDRHGDSATAVTEVRVSQPRPLRLPIEANGKVRVGGDGEYLVVELLAHWPAEHGQTRLVSDAVGAGDIGREPPRIGSVVGVYPERSERASDGATVVPVGFAWSELLRAGALGPKSREIVLTGRQGHVRDYAPYEQRLPVQVVAP